MTIPDRIWVRETGDALGYEVAQVDDPAGLAEVEPGWLEYVSAEFEYRVVQRHKPGTYEATDWDSLEEAERAARAVMASDMFRPDEMWLERRLAPGEIETVEGVF